MFIENNNSLREIITGVTFLLVFAAFIITAGFHI